jgi:hypothetical protein
MDVKMTVGQWARFSGAILTGMLSAVVVWNGLTNRVEQVAGRVEANAKGRVQDQQQVAQVWQSLRSDLRDMDARQRDQIESLDRKVTDLMRDMARERREGP